MIHQIHQPRNHALDPIRRYDTGFEEVQALVHSACLLDRLGYESVWVGDSLLGPMQTTSSCALRLPTSFKRSRDGDQPSPLLSRQRDLCVAWKPGIWQAPQQAESGAGLDCRSSSDRSIPRGPRYSAGRTYTRNYRSSRLDCQQAASSHIAHSLA